MEETIKEKLFKVRTINSDQDEFIITIGQHLATEKRFTKKEDAEEYIEKPKWDTVFALISEMLENLTNRTEKEDVNSSMEKDQ